MIRKIICILLLFAPLTVAAQTPVRVAFYNTENLFDTVRNPLTDDAAFTPRGANRWTGERYRVKLRNIATVIDSLGAAVVGLAEVENEAVVRDLVMALGTDYNYIHRTTSDPRGIDLALLYQGDRFIPREVRQIASRSHREFLYVRGDLLGADVHLVVCHLPAPYNSGASRERAAGALYAFTRELLARDTAARIIVMGDLNANPDQRILRRTLHATDRLPVPAGALYAPLGALYRQGYGSYAYRDRRNLFDNVLMSRGLLAGDGIRYRGRCGIFVRPWMLAQPGSRSAGYPRRTYSGGRYEGGFSDHLPVWAEFGHVHD